MKKNVWGVVIALTLLTTAQLSASTSDESVNFENGNESSEMYCVETEGSATSQESTWRTKLNEGTTYEFVYDANFTPFLKLNCRNPFSKTIMAIELGFDYKGYNSEDFLAPTGSVTVSVQIPSYESRESVTRLNARDDRSLNSLWFKRVVFSDGSILN